MDPAKQQHSETTSTTTAPSISDLTLTEVATVVHSSSIPIKPEGPFYFAEDNGVTHWLDGKTPPAGARLVTSSTVVIISPIPTSQLPSSENGPISTFSTSTLTNSYTEVNTATVLLNPTDSIKTSTKAYSRLGPSGWNSSTSTSQQNSQSADQGRSVAYGITKTVFANSTQFVGIDESISASRLQRRQVGALVVATIEGQVVSWTNEYQGEHETSISSLVVAFKTFQGALTVPGSLKFDDLPHFATFTDDTDIPPIFNPYRKLYFSGGYGYVPPPSDPYPPVSPPQLAVFNFYGNVSSNSPDAGLELDGEIGAGPRASESAYWIDAYSAWLGCANAGPFECQIDILGYDAFNTRITSQSVRQPPCLGLKKCTLTQVYFTDQFRELAGIQFEAFINEKPVSFYMDDLNLGWSNNSCAAQAERSSAQ
ncbi:MAG: hypothetical protein Q9167_006468 [Letrouitia subvulpina]